VRNQRFRLFESCTKVPEGYNFQTSFAILKIFNDYSPKYRSKTKVELAMIETFKSGADPGFF
jgi:hypothetical protein